MQSNKYTVDRFEGGMAVLLQRDDETIEKVVPKEALGPRIAEGDILHVTFNDNGEVIKSEFLKEETEEARQRSARLLKKLQGESM